MSEAERVWQLLCGDELLAELVVTGGDKPERPKTYLPNMTAPQAPAPLKRHPARPPHRPGTPPD